MDRRYFLGTLGALAAYPSIGSAASLHKAEIVVVGGGYGGATAAKYLRLFSNYTAKVTLIEPNAQFISCPLSNLVVGGSRSIGDLTSMESKSLKIMLHPLIVIKRHLNLPREVQLNSIN